LPLPAHVGPRYAERAQSSDGATDKRRCDGSPRLGGFGVQTRDATPTGLERLSVVADLVALLICALEQRRDELDAQSAPFVGRVSFHVDLDVNVTMRRVKVRVRPCTDEVAKPS
jgi:hypothetical protein